MMKYRENSGSGEIAISGKPDTARNLIASVEPKIRKRNANCENVFLKKAKTGRIWCLMFSLRKNRREQIAYPIEKTAAVWGEPKCIAGGNKKIEKNNAEKTVIIAGVLES